MADPIDYSKTQRILLLIDLHPLQTFRNPNSYLISVSATARRLLAFASLTQSLFSFKFFFSSLCPYLSTSVVDQLIGSLFPSSFNLPSETLSSLIAILTSVSIPAEFEVKPSRASNVASSLHKLVFDCTWESENDDLSGKANVEFPKICSNLVLLFSHLPNSISCLSEYMNLGVSSEALRDLDGFMVKFHELFGIVSKAFSNRDIHLSWIDVGDGLAPGVDCNKFDNFGGSMLLENGIKSYGWGFCPTYSIVLDSALIPFGLMYPKIGIPLQYLKCADSSQGHRGQLYLEILDVNGKPLGCKCSDLEFLDLNVSQGGVCNGESVWSRFGEGVVIKMQVQAILRYDDEDGKAKRCTSSSILVREFSGDTKKCQTKFTDGLFAYRVFDILSGHMSENRHRNNYVPIWSILLTFLYKEGCQALVSLSSNNEQITSILKPVTAHLALLSVTDNNKKHGWNQSDSSGVRERTCNTSVVETDDANGSQPEASTSTYCEPLRHGKRPKNKKSVNKHLCWSSFCNAAFECSDFNLVEIYFARKPESSKMLKFLMCWMKQIKKHSSILLPTALHHSSQSQQHVLLPPLCTQVNLMQENDVSFSSSETVEVFFGNLLKRIQHCLTSGADLQSFAERLVKLSIHVMSQISEKNHTAGANKNTTTELMELLLKKPKDMTPKLEFDNPTSEASDFNSTSKIIVREYELQVFLRMELLRSDVSENIKGSVKQKLVKQVCSLLEIIQYLVEGGIHGHVRLYDYVERTIRARYNHNLEDVVAEIYAQMDLLPFGEEDEIQAQLFNSEDSDQSWKENHDGYKMAKPDNVLRSGLAGYDDSSQPADENSESAREEEHARRIIEARERREKARRSLYTRMPDLQRVWAPRQLKASKGKSEGQKDTKRKHMRKARYSVVCETPMSERKHMCSSDGEKGHTDSGKSLRVVPKALFQDA
ncbi:unnamed protein product [Cuscuta epithymum]|uniref:Treslin N-terminal domain-containing protein n=1 Tax=Cuscuta epithymum TaxID=186058 RepID=A0AAV0C9P8_9ASTE|nr:unnamed protein product [Cuscuta epithymum]